jgi:tRNA-Thr(GGU) m(6)t(6)A37 methyltransferase TsaA
MKKSKLAEIKPIGIVHSSYKTRSDAPHQGDKRASEIEIFTEFVEGLKDIDEFSHLHVFYWLHQSKPFKLSVKTPWDENLHGLFATRSPSRINPIGYAVVQLVKRDRNILTVKNLDAIDGTPVLDIKPYIPKIDARSEAKVGWLEKNADFLQARIYEFETAIGYVGGKKGVFSGLNRHEVVVGCSAEFGGKKEYWSPQHLFVGAIETCIMTTFLWLLKRNNLGIISYRSKAAGKAQLKNKNFVFTEVTVKPIISVDSAKIKKDIHNLINEAGEQCMVSKSVNCPVILMPVIKTKQSGAAHGNLFKS